MSGTTQPRLRALVNGTEVSGLVLSAHVTSNNWFKASTFHATCAYDTAKPTGRAWFDPAMQATGQAVLPIEIQVATSAPAGASPSWRSLIQGQVDTVSVHPATGTVTIEGRDFTARLLDLRTTNTYQNQTSSQAVAALAAQAGLQSDVTATSTLIGTYYQIDHTATTHDSFSKARTAWELMSFLARNEGAAGFDLWVDGQTVHFHPTQASTAAAYPVTLATGRGGVTLAGATDLTLDRHLTIDKRIKVVVRSWHSKNKKAFTATYPANAAADAETRPILKPNLSAQQCTDLAQRTYAEIMRLARRAELHMPGELVLTPRQRVQIAGSGLSWDGTYFVESIAREIGHEGFSQVVSITNQPPENGTLI